MTLAEAIAELRTRKATIPAYISPPQLIVTTILNAVLSGELVPVDDADTIATLRAQLDSTLKDRALIIAERDRTFALMLARAEAAEAKLAEREAQVERLLEMQGDQDQALKDAEAQVARLVEALEHMKARAMWVRGDQAYREFPKFVLNATTAAIGGAE